MGSSRDHSNGPSPLRGLAEHPSARLPDHEFPPVPQPEKRGKRGGGGVPGKSHSRVPTKPPPSSRRLITQNGIVLGSNIVFF